jgi:hypothetical protein
MIIHKFASPYVNGKNKDFDKNNISIKCFN